MYDKQNTIIFSSVYLWNDYDRIKGTLHLTGTHIEFIADGFEQTHLQLSIPLSKITKLDLYKLFNITISGLHISTLDGKSNIFIVENARELKKQIVAFKDFSF